MAGWYELIDPAGVLTNIAAIQDDSVQTVDDDIRVPAGMENIIGIATVIDDAVATLQARIRAPSLRTIAELDIEPIIDGAKTFGSPPEGLLFPQHPIPVRATDSLRLEINSNPAAPAIHYGLVTFADGAIEPYRGRIYMARATANITLVAGTWVNGNIVFDQVLPPGNYQIVGLRARGTNLLAVRLNFVGDPWRPGCYAVNAFSDTDHSLMRKGGLGVWGRFNNQVPPTVECLGDTDTSQVFIVDLIKTD